MENKLTRSKSNLEQVLQAMNDQEKKRNYRQADKLQKEAQGIQKQIQLLQKKYEARRQKKEKTQMDLLLDQEKKKFYDEWDQKVATAQKQGEDIIAEQNNRHEEEVAKAKADFEAEEEEYHDSGAVIALKRKEESLSKQLLFMEAHSIQQEKLKLQAQEKQMFQKLRSEKLKIRLKQLKFRQQMQKEALRKKTQVKLIQLKNLKEEQEEIMVQKHKNLVNEFASEQEKVTLIKTGLIKNSMYTTTALSPSSKVKERAGFTSTKNLFSSIKSN